ncbi:hypothetical protein TI03_06470 [Achromatium sp. WMS1]|nr:hypothetical protein TI03_06470 [Achromatium sp. WMS1]
MVVIQSFILKQTVKSICVCFEIFESLMEINMRKILVVDDSIAARYVMRGMLKKRGCEVDSAESAKDGF